MKILVLSDDFPPEVAGGAGTIAFRMSKEFIAQGHKVKVFTTTQDKNSGENIVFENIEINRVYSKYHDRWRAYVSLYNPRVVGKLKKIIKKFKPDIIHAHNVHGHISYYALVLATRYAKVFMTAHDVMSFYPGTFTEFINPENLSFPSLFNYRVTALMLIRKFRFRYNPFRNTIIRHILKRIDGVIAVSHELKEALTQNGITVCGVIHNGIKVSEWDIPLSDVEVFKSSFGLTSSEVVLFGGRLSGAKGGNLILEAISYVSKSVPSVKLLVVGQKDFYAERMLKKAIELGIGDRVIFTGWLKEDDMKKAYASATVVTMPSVCFDSFPNGNLEAFAASRPVVSTCFGGSREIVRDGENGYIVNPFNVPSLANAIADLILNKEKARQFGKAGHDIVIKEYSIEKIAKRYFSKFE